MHGELPSQRFCHRNLLWFQKSLMGSRICLSAGISDLGDHICACWQRPELPEPSVTDHNGVSTKENGDL